MTWSPIEKAIHNRKLVICLILFCILVGLYSFQLIPKQENPDITVPVAIIRTYYPGATAQQVESLITKKIEDELWSLEGYNYSRSFSDSNVSSVIVQLNNGADVEKNWQDLRNKMAALQTSLPGDASTIEINTELDETAGFILSIWSHNYTYQQLLDHCQHIKKELAKVPGIARIELIGEQKQEIRVDVDLAKINTYGITLEDIVNILKVQNMDLPLGHLKTSGASINISMSKGLERLEDIKNTIIFASPHSGGVVRIQDVANVYWDLQGDRTIVSHNGENGILIAGYFIKDKNILPIGKEIELRLQDLEQKLPIQINLDKILFQPEDVYESVRAFTINLLWGMVFVILVVFLGMGLRNALVVSTAIPLSILVTFILMNYLDIKIHQVSIGALIIVLGMLVDNSIVISDAIQGRLDAGQDRLKACLEGTGEVAVPVFTATITTIAAFTPLLFLESIAGEYIASLPQVVIIALLVSFLVATLVIPSLAFICFKGSPGHKKPLDSLRHFFFSLLEKGLDFKLVTYGLIIIALIITGYLVSTMGMEFFPKADKELVYINLTTEYATDIEKTQLLAEEVNQILRSNPQILSTTTVVGQALPKFYYTLPIGTASLGFAQTLVKLDLSRGEGANSLSDFAHGLQEQLDSRLIGAKATVNLLEQGEPIGAPIQIRIVGEQQGLLEDGALKIRELLQGIPGTINITDDIRPQIYEYFLDIDFTMANYLGLSKYDIQKELNIAIQGREATVIRQQSQEYPVQVRGDIGAPQDLLSLAIKSPATGNNMLLKQVADLQLKHQLPAIRKYNGELTVTVSSDLRAGFSAIDVQRSLKGELDKLDLRGLEVVFDGDEKRIKDNFGDVGRLALLAILAIYMILLVQFNSLLQPVIILLTIPLSVIGSVIGLSILGQSLSFTAFLGMVSLIGIVVNNAIVLIDVINSGQKDGLSVREACKSAVLKRFRPIILGTATTIMGLAPLAFSGSNLFVPMSIALISGLLISTLLTLVIIPVTYSAIFSNQTLGRINYEANIN